MDADTELNEKEKKVINYMLKNMENIIVLSGGYLDIGDGYFDRNDLFNLACKLKIEDLY